MISYTVSGNTKRTESFLDAMIRGDIYSRIEPHARRGVEALREATPVDSGITAGSWDYEIVIENGGVSIFWINTNVIDGFSVAVGLQYGHGTGNGGYVEGQDYINPAIKPIFDDIANAVWKEVQQA